MTLSRSQNRLFRPLLGSLLIAVAGVLPLAAQVAAPKPAPMILDMVHHNPGEPRYETRYENPAVIKEMGFNGKVYYLFDAPTIAINWESVDPEIFPKGSPGRAWVDAKAAQIDGQLAFCKAAGIQTYAMADLVLFPKALVEKYKLEKTFGDPRDPQTDKFLRAMIRQIFERFPDLNGLVVRIGETYLEDAPFHQGHIVNKSNAEKTIIPLMNLLREEVCVQRKKQLVFRTWLSFDTDLKTYLAVSAAVEPHPNLVFGVKHCEGDFHRGRRFSKVLGQGRHPQLVEVQCAREYEGKGAYPNYIANGVIEGFEEHRNTMPADKMKSIRELTEKHPDLFAGIWTWTRGGGWFGPFIKNELWPDLNAWVMAQWAKDTTQSEESVFNRYATERLGLKGDDVAKFRRLALLSAEAVVRGKTTTRGELQPWWSRDDGINRPELPKDPAILQRALAEKAEAVRQWEEIVKLSREIQFTDPVTKDYVVISSEYGLALYRIYQTVVELTAAGDDAEKLRHWLPIYDAAWKDYRTLPAKSTQCATLYREASAPKGPHGEGLETFISRVRKIAEAGAKVEPADQPAK
jgi:hypothetical protein